MPFKVVCCPDSFKESMSASEAALIMAEGVRAVLPDAQCVQIPLSDGGEGFMYTVAEAVEARYVDVPLMNALGEQDKGQLAVVQDQAIIEVAQAVGLGMVPPQLRRIRQMNSFGVGQLILAALDRGVKRILIGLGGTGTNDGGAGMLRALGAHFWDEEGRELDGSPQSLLALAGMDLSGLDPRLKEIQISVACDVDSPLLGTSGASATFGPQKGGSAQDVVILEEALSILGQMADPKQEDSGVPGAGAAGGLGFAFKHFLGAELISGAQMVMDILGLEEAVESAALVLTGEGALDKQSLMGKTLSGVLRLAQEDKVPLIGFAGFLGDGVGELYAQGFTSLVPIVDRVSTLSEALAEGPANLRSAVERTIGLLVAGGRINWCESSDGASDAVSN